MRRRQLRVARGAGAAAIATLLAAAAHTLGGGGAPSPLFCALVAVLATPLAVLLAGSRPAWWRTSAAVAPAQLVFHLAFVTVGDLGAWAPHTGGHLHGGTSSLLPAPELPAHADMTLAHLLAGIVTVVALHRGEGMLRALGRVLLALFVPPAVPQPALPVASPPLVAATSAPAPADVVLRDLSPRGPPRAPALLAAS